MKNSIVVIILVLFFVGCEKAIQITQPIILIQNESPKVLDSIQINCVEYAEIDGVRNSPDYFSWSILDEDQQEIYSDFKDSSAIVWVPDSAGYYIISAKIGYDNNKSITTLKEVEIHESALSLQKRLVGKWTGTAESVWNQRWTVDLTFDEVGHYTGKGYDPNAVPGELFLGGPFKQSPYIMDFQRDLPSSEDVPCTRFLINKIIENKGFGRLLGSWETMIENNYHYECFESYDIEELKFSNNDEGLFFSLNAINSTNYDWEIKYNLTKVK